jgi:glycerophosphoryl diester phosphodiesterase
MIKAMRPRSKIGLLYQTALYEPWRYAAYVGADAIHPHYLTLKAPNVVRDCHLAGIAVHPWTIDDPVHLKMACALGVDAVITNTPDRAAAIRESMAQEGDARSL